jgi:CheY-like chemotaxis protein
VAEDEALVRMVAVDILEDAGWTVIEAVDAKAALSVLNKRSDVQCWSRMWRCPPGPLNGFDLARLTREQFPQVSVIIVSGKVRPSPGDLPPGARFVQKPYSATSLTRLVHETITSAA